MSNVAPFLVLEATVNDLVDVCFESSLQAGWWHDQETGKPILDNPYAISNKLCLIHSEISEAMEGDRTGAMDDKLPHRSALEVELADALIRIADLAGALDLDLGGAVAEKMEYNQKRADHKPENRIKKGGKKY